MGPEVRKDSQTGSHRARPHQAGAGRLTHLYDKPVGILTTPQSWPVPHLEAGCVSKRSLSMSPGGLLHGFPHRRGSYTAAGPLSGSLAKPQTESPKAVLMGRRAGSLPGPPGLASPPGVLQACGAGASAGASCPRAS